MKRNLAMADPCIDFDLTVVFLSDFGGCGYSIVSEQRNRHATAARLR